MIERKWYVVVFAMVLMVFGQTSVCWADGFLFVSSTPDGAALKVDGAVKGNTPLLLPLSSGKHSIEATLTGFKSSSQSISVADNEVTNISLTLGKDANTVVAVKPPVIVPPATGKGKVTILTDTPKALVYLDGIRMEQTTPTTLQDVIAGDHVLILAGEKYAIFKTITVMPTQTLVLKESFADAGKKAVLLTKQREGEVKKPAEVKNAVTLTEPMLAIKVKISQEAPKTEADSLMVQKDAISIVFKYKKAGSDQWESKALVVDGKEELAITLEKGTYDFKLEASNTRTKSDAVLGLFQKNKKVGEASSSFQRALVSGKIYSIDVTYDGKNTLQQVVTEKAAPPPVE